MAIENTTQKELLTTGTAWAGDFNYTYEFTTDFNSTNITANYTSNTSVDFTTVQTTFFTQNYTHVNISLPNPFLKDNSDDVLLLEAGLAALVIRCAFLAIFIIVGFISTCMLMTTLAQSNRKKPIYLNLFLINILSCNLLDCVVNLPLVLGATVTERWDYGNWLCLLNACFFQLTSITTMLGFCALYIDRCIAIKNPARYYSIVSLPKVNVLIIWCWIHGVALSFAPVAGLISADIFPSRYLCSMGKNNSIIYVSLVPLLGYIIPLFAIIGLSSAILHLTRTHRKRQKERKSKRQSPNRIMAAKSLDKEINTSKFVAVIFAIWVILAGPYLILNSVEQILKSDLLKSTYVSQGFKYPWQMELTFTWLRMSFPMFLPFITFAWRRDVWHKFKNLIFCRKSNLIDEQSQDGTSEARNSIISSNVGVKDTIGRKKGQQAAGFTAPMLYATEKGIHVETLSKRTKTARTLISPEHFESRRDLETGENDVDEREKTEIFTARKCDVIGSQDLLQIDDDTSDYDSNSETDPFAASNQGLTNPDTDDKSKTRSKKTSTSNSRHNSEVVLITASDKSFDNEAFITNEDDPTPSLKPEGQQKVKHRKERTMDSMVSQTDVNEGKPDQERSMRHIRCSSDSGRGSEEGTISRREKSSHAQISDQDPVLAHVTPNETDVQQVDVERSPREKSKVRRKKRRKKKISDEENIGVDPGADVLELEKNGENIHTNLMAMEQVMTRPPIRLKPLPALPSPNPSSPNAPLHLSKTLPSPYKTVGSAGRSPKRDSSLVQAKESDGVKYYNISESEKSVITEPVTSDASAAKPANIAARRRRTNTLTKSVVPDRLAESDLSCNIQNSEQYTGSTASKPGQRLTHSDSAADLRLLSQAKVGEEKKSPRPSPRPRKPRRVADLQNTEVNHTNTEDDLTCW